MSDRKLKRVLGRLKKDRWIANASLVPSNKACYKNPALVADYSLKIAKGMRDYGIPKVDEHSDVVLTIASALQFLAINNIKSDINVSYSFTNFVLDGLLKGLYDVFDKEKIKDRVLRCVYTDYLPEKTIEASMLRFASALAQVSSAVGEKRVSVIPSDIKAVAVEVHTDNHNHSAEAEQYLDNYSKHLSDFVDVIVLNPEI